jgi:hypothetical protein
MMNGSATETNSGARYYDAARAGYAKLCAAPSPAPASASSAEGALTAPSPTPSPAPELAEGAMTRVSSDSTRTTMGSSLSFVRLAGVVIFVAAAL